MEDHFFKSKECFCSWLVQDKRRRCPWECSSGGNKWTCCMMNEKKGSLFSAFHQQPLLIIICQLSPGHCFPSLRNQAFFTDPTWLNIFNTTELTLLIVAAGRIIYFLLLCSVEWNKKHLGFLRSLGWWLGRSRDLRVLRSPNRVLCCFAF